jgi:hypothetical protein
MRAFRWTLAVFVFTAASMIPDRVHVPLDPDEPVAADGSLMAGRMRTIFDFDPVLSKPKPANNSDDPEQVAARIAIEKPWTDRSREAIVRILGPMDWSFCEEFQRKRTIAAVRAYYNERGLQKASFLLGGPRAKAAIEQAWSTPVDRRIDEFTRQLVASGFLHPRDVPERSFPEFAKVVAQTKIVGAACPSLKVERL